MREILLALTHLAQRTGRFTVAEATALYHGAWMILGFMLVACAGAFWLNAMFGWTTPSLMLAIAFMIVAVYMWAKPLHILAVAGGGAAWGLVEKISGDTKLVDEVVEVLKKYLGLLKWVLLAGVTFLFITGTVPFGRNPKAVLIILVALGVYGLFVWAWPDVFKGSVGRRIVYGYAVFMIAWSFVSLSPASGLLEKYTSWNPTDTGAVSGMKQVEQVTCPDPLVGETRSCFITIEWAKPLSGATAGPTSYGKSLCFFPEKDVEVKKWNNTGGTFWQFRAKQEQVSLKYRFMDTCPEGELPG